MSEKKKAAFSGDPAAAGSSVPETPDEPVAFAASLPDSQAKKKPGKAKKAVIIAAAAVALIAIVLVSGAAILVSKLSEPIVAEVGEPVDLSRFDSGIAKLACRIEADDDLTTDKIGTKDIKATFFGFLDRSIPLTVRDTTPPEFTLRSASVMAGIRLSPEDLVTGYSDKTRISFSFESEPDFSTVSEEEVTVIAEDEGGNLTKKATALIVSDVPFAPDFEFGTTAEEIEARIRADHPEAADIDLSELDVTKCGEYKAGAESDDTYFLFYFHVRDTVAPTARVASFDVLLGDTVDEDRIVTEVSDLSPTSVAFGAAADFAKAGTYEIPVTVSDDQGNALSLTSKIVVHDLNASITTEPVSSNKELLGLIFKDKNESLSLPDGFSASKMSFGVNYIDLVGEFSSVRVSVTVEDTVPPVLKLRSLSVPSGKSVTPEQFVASCQDASPVTYSFESPVSTKTAGKYKVTVVAVDSAGNKTAATATLTVTAEKAPPEPEPEPTVTLDTVNEIADGILSQIINDSMTQREKAQAIFKWCTSHLRYSTSTSHLMGHFVDAAYSGFKTRRGNCYVYYSVASTLLTRAGIENIEIHRDSETNPHYWNLVNVESSWYHFDTCPHYKEYPIKVFLLTDAEVEEYSQNAAIGYYSFDKSLYPRTP